MLIKMIETENYTTIVDNRHERTYVYEIYKDNIKIVRITEKYKDFKDPILYNTFYNIDILIEDEESVKNLLRDIRVMKEIIHFSSSIIKSYEVEIVDDSSEAIENIMEDMYRRDVFSNRYLCGEVLDD